jgi:hypothetical protein
MSPGASALLLAVAGRLADAHEELATAIVARHDEEMTAGGLISPADARAWVLTVLRAVTVRFGDPAADGSAEREVVERLTRDRALIGFPLDALLRSFQLGARELLVALDREAAGEPALTPAVQLEIHDFCWEWANQAMGVVAAVHRQVGLELARRDSARRSEFVVAVLSGALPEPRLSAEAPAFGLDPALPYLALRAAPGADAAAGAGLEQTLASSGALRGARPVFAVLDGDLVGLAPRRPQATGAAVGIGRLRPLAAAADSFGEATEALRTAVAFGISGVLALDELGPRPLALADGPAGRRLAERYLPELRAHDRRGEIARTMVLLLEHDGDVRAAAAALHVHPNTVRYRSGRFAELTGLDIRRTEDLILTWWLLNRARLTDR